MGRVTRTRATLNYIVLYCYFLRRIGRNLKWDPFVTDPLELLPRSTEWISIVEIGMGNAAVKEGERDGCQILEVDRILVK